MRSWAIIGMILLASVLYVNGNSPGTSADSSCLVDTHYYRGAAIFGVSIGPEGSMVAVRFTPPRNGSALIAVQFYILGPWTFNVQILSEKRTPILKDLILKSVSTGWARMELSKSPLTFVDDFYVALGFPNISGGGTPLIAAESGNPSGRNYDIFHMGNALEWRPSSSDPNYNVTRTYLIDAIFAISPYLDIESPVGGTRGQGCYEMGATAEISTPPSVDDGEGRMLVFDGWSGDYSGNNTSVSIQLTKFMTSIKANYRTMYRIDFVSQFGLPLNGTGWYESGSILNLTPPERLWIVFTFQRIEVDSNSSTSGKALMVLRPMHLVAIYQLDISTVILIEGMMIGASLLAWAILRYRRRRASRMIWFRAPKS